MNKYKVQVKYLSDFLSQYNWDEIYPITITSKHDAVGFYGFMHDFISMHNSIVAEDDDLIFEIRYTIEDGFNGNYVSCSMDVYKQALDQFYKITRKEV